MRDALSIYAPANRARLLALSAFLVVVIALADWGTERYLALGILYLFPIMIVGGFLSRVQIIAVALACAVLQEVFSYLPVNEAVARLLFSSAGFVGTGLFISEMVKGRRTLLEYLAKVQEQTKLRRDAEEQLQILVESSPAAIVIIDLAGMILMANQAARQLLSPDGQPLEGQAIHAYLPSLQKVVQSEPSRLFRTALQCRGQRSDGQAFLAGIWFSTYATLSGPRLAAIVVDLSEELRNREDLSLEYLLKNSRILMSAVAHEVRNLCGAVVVVHKNLSRIKALEHNEDFHALGTLIQSLEKVSALERTSAPAQNAAAVDLTSVLDELRVLIGAAYHEAEMEVQWHVQDSLPLVWADRFGLVQVFLNLAKNSQRAMESTDMKRLRITATQEGSKIVVHFEDSGAGIASPENLFRPFQRGADATGLGLYVSRAIMKSFGGDLVYEPRSHGCCFVIAMPVFKAVEENVNA